MVVRYPFYGKTITAEFLGVGWDPDHSASQEGPGSIVSSLPKTYEGAGVLAKLQHSEQGVHYSQSQSVTQTRERKTSLTQEVSWDFGAEQTIGGSAFGVSLEAKFSEHFGTKIDTGQEDSEGTSDTVTKQIDFDFPPLRDTLLTLDTAQIQTRADLTIIGRTESGLRITCPVGGKGWQYASTWWPHFATPKNHGFVGKPGLAIFEWKDVGRLPHDTRRLQHRLAGGGPLPRALALRPSWREWGGRRRPDDARAAVYQCALRRLAAGCPLRRQGRPDGGWGDRGHAAGRDRPRPRRTPATVSPGCGSRSWTRRLMVSNGHPPALSEQEMRDILVATGWGRGGHPERVVH